MIPLSIFLLACAALYLGVIEAAFSALMRLSLRLVAERSDRPGFLDTYLDDPLLLFIPVRLLLGIVPGPASVLLAAVFVGGSAHAKTFVVPSAVAFVRVLFREQEYSRFPVFKESLDNIAGFIFVKDLVALSSVDDARPIVALVRPAVFVPETKRVPELLKQFQRQQTQCAIVVDEYGGTAVLVTIEDLLEEIVGEIRDEYDVESELFVDEGEGRFVVSGKANIDELAQRLHVDIERGGFETVGGYLLSHIGRVPAVGEKFDVDGLHVDVLDAERRRITKVRIYRNLSTAD